MELTDHWGGAMFIIDRDLVLSVFSAVGFSEEVASAAYDAVRSLGYVEHRQPGQGPKSEFTWHGADGAVMILRGIVDLESAMSGVDDNSVEDRLRANLDIFHKLMDRMPSFTANLMFSVEIASGVLGAFGARVSPDLLFDLAYRFGGRTTQDLEGRRGVSTQYLRSLSLTLSAFVF